VNQKKKEQMDPNESGNRLNVNNLFQGAANRALNQSKNVLGKVVNGVTKVAGNVKGIITDPNKLVEALDASLDSRKDTIQFARYLFESLLNERSGECLTVKEFEPAFETPEEAQEAFDHFDTDLSGEVTKLEFRSCFMKSYDDRRAIENSLRDFGNVIGSLDSLMLVFCSVCNVIIVMVLFGVQPTNIFSSVGGVLLASSFLFSATAKAVFESIIFLMIV
jgi:small-conductance mechanosensitive channel